MRKVKKINGYLVVKFSDRELREWEGSGLGTYGVIDAELYTGQLEIDRGVMEYDDADSLEVAIEQARGLESELDVEEIPATYTLVTEEDELTKEEVVDPQLLINGFETSLEHQIIHQFICPDVTPATARHQLYGYKIALHHLGLLDIENCFVPPSQFNPEDPETFENLPPEKRDSKTARNVYALGQRLEEECPENDCRIYLNIFRMCRELDEQAPLLKGWPRKVVEMNLHKQYLELEQMFVMNHAIKKYKQGLQT